MGPGVAKVVPRSVFCGTPPVGTVPGWPLGWHDIKLNPVASEAGVRQGGDVRSARQAATGPVFACAEARN
eukprot:7155329-Lingulodinium_polyedra.AAC.1